MVIKNVQLSHVFPIRLQGRGQHWRSRRAHLSRPLSNGWQCAYEWRGTWPIAFTITKFERWFGRTCEISTPTLVSFGPIRLATGKRLHYEVVLRQQGLWIDVRELYIHVNIHFIEHFSMRTVLLACELNCSVAVSFANCAVPRGVLGFLIL